MKDGELNELVSDTVQSGKDIVNSIFQNLPKGKQTLLEVSQDMLEGSGGKKIVFEVINREVNPEKPVMPDKKDSPKRHHTFNDAVSLAEYIKKYKTEDTVVLVDIMNERAYAIIDEKADKGFECVEMKPVVHPLARPWMGLFGSSVDIRTFADFIMENRRSIVQPDGRALAHDLSQVKVSRSTELHRGFGNKSLNGIMCEMEIKGNKQSTPVDLPDSFVVEVPLYLSTEPVLLEIDLTLDADDSEVYAKCTSADLLEKRVQAFESMLEQIKAIEGVIVTIGRPDYESWDYVSKNIR